MPLAIFQALPGVLWRGEKGHYFRGTGTKTKFWGEQGNKNNTEEQGTFKKKNSNFGEQGN